MIPSRLEYRCIKSGVGYGGTEELGTVVTEFDSRHLIIFFPQFLLCINMSFRDERLSLHDLLFLICL